MSGCDGERPRASHVRVTRSLACRGAKCPGVDSLSRTDRGNSVTLHLPELRGQTFEDIFPRSHSLLKTPVTREVTPMIYRPRTKAKIAIKTRRCRKCGSLMGKRTRCKRCGKLKA